MQETGKNNVDIFIYSHIPFKPVVKNQTYKVLTHCTDEIDTELEVYRDYVGDNIGDMNLMYNEYTGLYWLWKNYELKDYIGLNHYRRAYGFFDSVPDFDEVFKEKKICLSQPLKLDFAGREKKAMTNEEWYRHWHNIDDLYELGDLIDEEYPEYTEAFDRMLGLREIINSNMFTMKKATFIEYCNFIFPLLQKYRERTGLMTVDDCIRHVEANQDKYIRDYAPYYNVRMQARIIGYVAERALQTFLMHGGKESLWSNAEFIKWYEI